MINKIKALKNHTGFRRYGANTAWMFGEQILRMIAGLLVGIWVARYLGPEQFGIFSYALAFTAIFAGIAKLGLDGIVVRDLVNHPEKRDAYLGTAFWLKVMGAFLAMIAIASATLFTSNDSITNVYIFIIASGIIFQSFEVIDFYFQSKVLSRFVSISKMTQLFFSSLLKIYFVLTGADLLWFVLISLFDQITLALALIYAYYKQAIGNYYRHFDKAIAKQLLSHSWPLIFSSLIVMIYMRIDQVMIKEMLGMREVGIYSAAVRISEVWYFVPAVIISSLFPSVLNAKSTNPLLYKQRIQHLYDFMAWIGIFVAIITTLTATWVINLLYGNAYSESAEILSIQIWAGVGIAMTYVHGKWILAENLQRYSILYTSVAVTINILLNLYLIPIYGAKGAAIATLFAQLVPILIQYFILPARENFFMMIKALYAPVRWLI